VQSFQQAIEAVDFYSPAEERFNRRRRTVGLCAAPLIFVGLLLWPMPALAPPAHRLLAVLAVVATLWMTEAVPLAIAAVLGPALVVVLGVAPAPLAFAPFADPIVFLFIGSFILAEAMFVHGLDRWIACRVLAMPWLGTSGMRLLVAYVAVTVFVSMWVNNTATTAMMFPIGMALIAQIARAARPGDQAVREFAGAMMLATAFGACLGGMAAPVGTPPNLIGIGMLQRLAGVRISFVGWMAFGVPMAALLTACLIWLIGRGGVRRFTLPVPAADLVRDELARLGPMSPGQRNVALAFGGTVLLWVLPGLLGLRGTGASAIDQVYSSPVPEGVAAILGAALLFVLPIDWKTRRFTLTWEEAARIDWGIVLVYGGGLALGELAFSTGLAAALGQPLVGGAGVHTTLALTVAFTAAAILLSQMTSNTAAAAILVPIAIAACQTARVSPVEAALGATLGASMGLVLPISTASNAIVYSSGYVPVRAMIRTGIVLDLLALLVIVAAVTALGPLFH